MPYYEVKLERVIRVKELHYITATDADEAFQTAANSVIKVTGDAVAGSDESDCELKSITLVGEGEITEAEVFETENDRDY